MSKSLSDFWHEGRFPESWRPVNPTPEEERHLTAAEREAQSRNIDARILYLFSVGGRAGRIPARPRGDPAPEWAQDEEDWRRDRNQMMAWCGTLVLLACGLLALAGGCHWLRGVLR